MISLHQGLPYINTRVLSGPWKTCGTKLFHGGAVSRCAPTLHHKLYKCTTFIFLSELFLSQSYDVKVQIDVGHKIVVMRPH
jgi:hypothetical protein